MDFSFSAEQEAIRIHVLASHPTSMKLDKFGKILHRFCLNELLQRAEVQ